MSDDEILRPTIIKSLVIGGIKKKNERRVFDVDPGSFRTYDLKGQARFQFKDDGITISGLYSSLISGHVLPRVTRGEFEQSRDGKLPEIVGYSSVWPPRIRALVFEEFYVNNPRQGKRTKDNEQ